MKSDRIEFFSSFLKKRLGRNGEPDIQSIRPDGSQRLFQRVSFKGDSESFILMVNPPRDEPSRRENNAYLRVGRHLRNRGAPVPEIYEYDLERGWFILEDLGRESLQERIQKGEEPLSAYRAVLDVLLKMQLQGAQGFDTAWCCQTPRYDREVMHRFETEYFCEAFLRNHLHLKEPSSALRGAFDHLARRAALGGCDFFLHRDFQSRNILVKAGAVGIVDWQGGRMGPLGYDVASLLIDPYTGLSSARQEILHHYYRDALYRRAPQAAPGFEKSYPYLAVQRNLQILGAFAYLSDTRGKPHFAAYIPRAVQQLCTVLSGMDDPSLQPLAALAEELRGGFSEAKKCSTTPRPPD